MSILCFELFWNRVERDLRHYEKEPHGKMQVCKTDIRILAK